MSPTNFFLHEARFSEKYRFSCHKVPLLLQRSTVSLIKKYRFFFQEVPLLLSRSTASLAKKYRFVFSGH